MRRLFSWIGNHKLVTVLLVVILWLWLRNTPRPLALPMSSTLRTFESAGDTMVGAPAQGIAGKSLSYPNVFPNNEAAPTTDIANRMVVQNSYMSLLVKNVSEAVQQIKNKAVSLGGYMVDANLSNPQEAATGDITVRIPAEKMDETLAYYRSLGVKVVSENLQGTDVTDQFVDNKERLRILERNKARMEEIMNKATEISDITSIQQQIFSIQSQIDSIKGQQNYLEKTAALVKVTIYLSTDELSLPYAPNTSWRPALIFKQAVRSLLENLQKFGSALIWLLVYSIIIVPLVIVFFILTRFFKKQQRV